MRKEDRQLLVQNTEIYRYYYERLVNLALSQFEWHGLPDTCDRLYFERTLLFSGKAAFVKPEGTDFWLSVDYLQTGNFDVYGYPTDIKGIGYNARNIETTEWMVLYDNMTKSSLLPKIDLYARLLWEVHSTFRSNLQHQITPYVVATSRNQALTFKNFFNRLLGFQPVIEVKNTEDIETAIKTLDLRVDFKGKELLETLQTVWREALSMLGISSQSTKKERLLDGEITMDRQADILSLNSRLLNRVDFCNKMNKKYGLELSVNLSSQDYDFTPYGQHDLDTMGREEEEE